MRKKLQNNAVWRNLSWKYKSGFRYSTVLRVAYICMFDSLSTGLKSNLIRDADICRAVAQSQPPSTILPLFLPPNVFSTFTCKSVIYWLPRVCVKNSSPLFQKDERSLYGNFQRSKLVSTCHKCGASHHSLPASSSFHDYFSVSSSSAWSVHVQVL